MLLQMFSSNCQQKYAEYSEMIQSAESKLIEWAHKYDEDYDHEFDSNNNEGSPQNNKNIDKTVELKTIDTKIPLSVLPLKKNNKKFWWERWSFTSNDAVNKDDNNGEYDDDEFFTIHGVKAVSSSSQSTTNSSSSSPPLVLLHGYGAASLSFYRNLVGLSKYFGTVYSLDKLGWGNSSRITSLPNQLKDKTVQTTQDFFIDSLEEWRKINNIPKIILAGHSMGGYLSAAYAEKYPERVERLILLSPAGVPRKNNDNDNEKINEWKKRSIRFSIFTSVASSMWNNGITPGNIFQNVISEDRGRSIIRGRIGSAMTEEESNVMVDYLYANLQLPLSGESMLPQLLGPTAHAYEPLIDRIPKLLSKKPNTLRSISFIYGERDWMDYRHAIDVRNQINNSNKSNNAMMNDAELPSGKTNTDIDIYVVRDASHHVMWKNWKEFNSAVILAAGGNEEELPMNSPIPHIV